MNKELLYAAHQLHGMIKIKDEELIDPRGSYPRIKLSPGAAFVCFADDIPALIAIGHLCRINRQKRCKIIADRMTDELLPADEKLLRTFGGENIFVDVAGSCTRSPNAAAVVSQSRYLPAKKHNSRVFGIREDFDEVCNAPETYLPQFLSRLNESFRCGINFRGYMDGKDKYRLYAVWCECYRPQEFVRPEDWEKARNAFERKVDEICLKV